MIEEEEQTFIDNHGSEIIEFFREKLPSKKHILNCYKRGDFIIDKDSILRYLQTAFIDEQICEVVIEGFTRTYLCKLWDDEPEVVEQVDEDGNITMVEAEYNPGDYLRKMDKIYISPLECGLGNFHVVFCNKLVLRLVVGTKTIELGVNFVKRDFDRKIPSLQFSFPQIGIISGEVRLYRAKVPKNFDIEVATYVKKKKKGPQFLTRPLDISAEGISLIMNKEHMKSLEIDEKRRFEIRIPGSEPFVVTGTIRHLSKVREKSIIQYICGLKFDIESRAMAMRIEGIVATVQRSYLRELATKSEELGINLKS